MSQATLQSLYHLVHQTLQKWHTQPWLYTKTMCTSVTTKGVPPELMTIASFQRPKTVQQRQHVLTGRNSKVAPKQMNQQEITNDIIIVSFLTKKMCVVLYLWGWVIECRQAPEGELVGILCCCLPPLHMQPQPPFAMDNTMYKQLLLWHWVYKLKEIKLYPLFMQPQQLQCH